MIRSLHSGMVSLPSFLDSQPTQRYKPITFALASETALKKALDTAPHGDQAESIKLLERLGRLLDKYPINITLLWLPRKTQFIGFRRVKHLALETARTADLTTISEPQTINNQLKQAETAAIDAWADRYNRAPHTSMAYRTALTTPPDRRTHRTFQIKSPAAPPTAGNTPTDPNADRSKATYSRLTHSTLYRFITGHAFTGEYTR